MAAARHTAACCSIVSSSFVIAGLGARRSTPSLQARAASESGRCWRRGNLEWLWSHRGGADGRNGAAKKGGPSDPLGTDAGAEGRIVYRGGTAPMLKESDALGKRWP